MEGKDDIKKGGTVVEAENGHSKYFSWRAEAGRPNTQRIQLKKG
jgi:hypothetical protein